MTERPISKFAIEVLRRVAASGEIRRTETGAVILRGKTIPPSVVRALERQDFLNRRGGFLAVTESGRAFLRRRESRPRPVTGEGVDGFRAQHMRLGVRRRSPGRSREGTLVNHAESPLGWLARRRGKNGKPMLSERQLLAGERLRSDFERAGLGPKTTRAYDAPPPGRGRHAVPVCAAPTDFQIDARRRIEKAVGHVGPGLGDILMRVCCFLEGLEDAERGLGWPARSGKLVLGLALDRLADFYDGEMHAPEGKKTGARRAPG